MDKLLTQKGKIQNPNQEKERESTAATSGGEKKSSVSSDFNASEGNSTAKGGQNNPSDDPSKDPAENTPVELSKKSWDDAEKDKKNSIPWMNDPKGRLAVRTFSRGVMGAGFFVAGGMLCRKWMKGYDPTKSFLEQSQRNPISFIAKGIDTVVGKPIEAAVKLATGDAEMAKSSVLFRQTFRPGKNTLNGTRMWGRSLGAEVVDITFDFFCASIGDAFGRDLVNTFDPHVKKDWIDDKGHVDLGKVGKHSLNAAFRYVTYNGGEDWAVAIPYAYFMKGQRSVIDKMSPGFRYDFDQGKFGNSFKVGGHPLKDGKVDFQHQSHITGNYALEGMLDLQSRFTVYNIGTLMYREVYNHVKDTLQGKPSALYGAPDQPKDPHKGLASKAVDTVKWVTRSVIKGVITMTPSVPFFWITRSTQLKHRGLFIHPEHGMLTAQDPNDPTGRFNRPVEAATYTEDPRIRNRDVFYSRYNFDKVGKEPLPFDRLGPMNASTANPGAWPNKDLPRPDGYTGPMFHPYREGTGILDKAFDRVGSTQYDIAQKFSPLGDHLDQHGGALGGSIKTALDMPGGTYRGFISPMVRASMSYTPYMYAKAEAANMWDNGKTDMAAERFIDGLFSGNLKEIKAGMGEIGRAVLHKPLKEVDREIEAERRIQIDTSAPGVMTVSEFATEKEMEAKEFTQEQQKILQMKQIEADKKRQQEEKQKQKEAQQPLTWQERTIQARPEDRPEVGANRPKSHAEQEAMRKALEEMHPPTNAIN